MKRVAAGFGVIAVLMLWAAPPVDAQGVQRPRDTSNTRAADDALEDGDDASDEAERLEHFQEALSSAEAEIADNANNPLGYRLAALAALGLGQYADAAEFFDRADVLYPLYEVEHVPLREQTWINLYQEASPLVGSGDYEEAAVIFENAHAIFKNRPEIMVTLAQIYGSLGDVDRSIEFVDEVMAFMSSDFAAVADSTTFTGWQAQTATLPLFRAQVLRSADRLEEAAEAYQGLRESDPSNPDYALDLAEILLDLGNEAESLELYEQLLSTPGVSGPDYYAIGVGFYQADDYGNAVRGFSGAAEQNPRDRDALEMWARSLQLDSIYAEVPPVARRWVELDPNSQSGWAILAQAANFGDDTETTQEAMTAIQELECTVEQLGLQRLGEGGGIVRGTVVNKTLEVGTSVTLRLTFYGTDGDSVGSSSETISVAEAGTPQPLEAQVDATETVGGYSYELTIG